MMPMKKMPSKRGSCVRAARWHWSGLSRKREATERGTPPIYTLAEPSLAGFGHGIAGSPNAGRLIVRYRSHKLSRSCWTEGDDEALHRSRTARPGWAYQRERISESRSVSAPTAASGLGRLYVLNNRQDVAFAVLEP